MARRVPLDDLDTAIQVIKEDGGVVVTGFASPEQVKQVNRDIEEPLMMEYNQQTTTLEPQARTHCSLLFGKSETAREVWLMQKNVQAILRHFLQTVSIHLWNPENKRVTDPILSLAMTMITRPGGADQDLHRDDSIWQHAHSNQQKTGYRLGSDLSVGILVPGMNLDKNLGGTWFVPKSHLSGDDRRPLWEEAVMVEMKVGEAFIFLASAVHAGAKNRTQTPRLMHGFFFCRSWIRSEENRWVWWTKEEVQKWSKEAQKLAGYTLDTPTLGHCGFENPVDVMRIREPRVQ